jgi:predicted nucleotidyltransferase component of viral defense system
MMEKFYEDTVRLLLMIAPKVFENTIFAMKGGTAINLFVMDMPRLSVDIDVVYLPWQVPRDNALKDINTELANIQNRISAIGLNTRLISATGLGDVKLIVLGNNSQVKVEVNVVFRGTVLPAVNQPLNQVTQNTFATEFEVPILAVDELYGSKIVAALDRQHPRDLFDIWRMYETMGLSDGMIECFVMYLAGHNRPMHEVLFSPDKNMQSEYETAFFGMTRTNCDLDTLIKNLIFGQNFAIHIPL